MVSIYIHFRLHEISFTIKRTSHLKEICCPLECQMDIKWLHRIYWALSEIDLQRRYLDPFRRNPSVPPQS